MFCGLKGNHRPSMAPAIHHRLSGLATYKLKSIDKEMNAWPMFPRDVVSFTLPFILGAQDSLLMIGSRMKICIPLLAYIAVDICTAQMF